MLDYRPPVDAIMSAQSASIPFISSQEVEGVLHYQDLVPAIEQALGDFSRGKEGGVVQPLRLNVPVKKQDG